MVEHTHLASFSQESLLRGQPARHALAKQKMILIIFLVSAPIDTSLVPDRRGTAVQCTQHRYRSVQNVYANP